MPPTSAQYRSIPLVAVECRRVPLEPAQFRTARAVPLFSARKWSFWATIEESTERNFTCLQCRISPRSFTAELTSAAKRGVYSAYVCLQCGISPRSFTAELTSAAKRGVYSAEFHCGAALAVIIVRAT